MIIIFSPVCAGPPRTLVYTSELCSAESSSLTVAVNIVCFYCHIGCNYLYNVRCSSMGSP